MSDTFDRLRPRDGGAPAGQVRQLRAVGPGTVDAEGKRSLFSTTEPSLKRGFVLVDCPRCATRSALTPRQLLRNAVPSVHLPLLRRDASWMRCPACRRRGWLRARIRV